MFHKLDAYYEKKPSKIAVPLFLQHLNENVPHSFNLLRTEEDFSNECPEE